jgi:hypothetical protein
VSEPDSPASQARRPAEPGDRPASLRQTVAAALLLLTLAGALAGCGGFDAALGRQVAVVEFKSDTSLPILLRIRTACARVPHVQAQRLPRVDSTMKLVYAVSYSTDGASQANLAALQQCLQKFPAVMGIEFEDSGDS